MNAARLLWSLIPAGRCRLLLAVSALLGTLSAVVALVPAFVVYVLAEIIFNRIDIGLDVMQVVFVGIAAVIARLGLLLVARNAAGTATEFLSQSMRSRAAVTIGALPLGVIAETASGSFETILLDDVETVGQYVSGPLVDLIGAWAMLLAAAVVLLACNWRDATAALALTLAVTAFLRFRALRAAAEVERERLAREKLAATVFAAVRVLALQLSLPPAPGSVHPVRRLAEDDRQVTDLRLARSAALRARRVGFATALPAAVVLAAVVLSGTRLDLPTLVLFAAFGLRLTGALGCVLRADTTGAPAREAAQRIRALLDRPPIAEGTAELPDDATLRFAHVDFAYPAATGGRAVLHDIDFVAKPGQVTAIVGPSGSGKTTVTRLAARLWDVDRGSVTLGGVDVRSFPVDALMRRIACVFQDVALLDDTVAANLKLGRPDAGDEEMMLAASAAGAHAFISALPEGYQTLVGDRGLFLSRGERQRLQIARALIKNAPVVILDEPTASMDPATEFEVQAALAPLFAGKTVLVVAHRLTTIVGAQRIVVLGRDGGIEAQGTHAVLLATSPTYLRLWSDYCASFDWSPGAQSAAR
ncbi:MAG: ABC transporter ATP-binding protein [Candidatus Velthaea sp.]